MKKPSAPQPTAKAARPPLATPSGRFAGRAARQVSVVDMADAVMAEAASRRAPPSR